MAPVKAESSQFPSLAQMVRLITLASVVRGRSQGMAAGKYTIEATADEVSTLVDAIRCYETTFDEDLGDLTERVNFAEEVKPVTFPEVFVVVAQVKGERFWHYDMVVCETHGQAMRQKIRWQEDKLHRRVELWGRNIVKPANEREAMDPLVEFGQALARDRALAASFGVEAEATNE